MVFHIMKSKRVNSVKFIKYITMVYRLCKSVKIYIYKKELFEKLSNVNIFQKDIRTAYIRIGI